jgi:hypothetical protein
MRTEFFEDEVRPSTGATTGLATLLATFNVANSYSEPVTKDLVGRPGLDPSILRLSRERPAKPFNVQDCWPQLDGLSTNDC